MFFFHFGNHTFHFKFLSIRTVILTFKNDNTFFFSNFAVDLILILISSGCVHILIFVLKVSDPSISIPKSTKSYFSEFVHGDIFFELFKWLR